MSWPPGQIPITVTGKYFDASRQPLTGTVTFELTIPLTDVPDQQFLRGAPVTGQIGIVTPGAMSVQVACNDSPGLTPAGSLYKVTERVQGVPVSVSYYSFSSTLGATADLSQLTPVARPADGSPLLQQYLVEPTGTPQPGDVPMVTEPGSNQTAWGFIGGVTEVNGEIGEVVITAAGINADPLGAAATAQANAEAAATAAIGALTAASVGADPAGSAATAQSNAEAAATAAIGSLTAASVGADPAGAATAAVNSRPQAANTAAVAPVSIGTSAGEVTVAQITVPGGLSAPAAYRITAWGTVAIGGTAGTMQIRARIGGTLIAALTTGTFAISATGSWTYICLVSLQSSGTSASWSGVVQELITVTGSTGTGSNAGSATKDSTVSEVFSATVTLASATSTAVCTGSVAERIC